MHPTTVLTREDFATNHSFFVDCMWFRIVAYSFFQDRTEVWVFQVSSILLQKYMSSCSESHFCASALERLPPGTIKIFGQCSIYCQYALRKHHSFYKLWITLQDGFSKIDFKVRLHVGFRTLIFLSMLFISNRILAEAFRNDLKLDYMAFFRSTLSLHRLEDGIS